MKFIGKTILPSVIMALLTWLLFVLVKGAFPVLRQLAPLATFTDDTLTGLCLLAILLFFVLPWWLSAWIDRHNYREETKKRLLKKICPDDSPWQK